MPTLSKNIQSKMKGTGFEFFADEHVYLMDGRPMTGITTILGSVIAKPQLIPWAARMAVEYIKEVAESGETPLGNKFWTVGEVILEEAKTAYAKKRDEGAQKGTDTHALVEEYIKECIEKNDGLPVLYHNERNPIAPFLAWASTNVTRFLASEAQLYSKEMFVAGTADFIFEKDGKTYIGDIKTYKKIWDRTPFYQCAGYGLMHREMTGSEIAGYVIFNLPKEREHNPEEDVLWSFDTSGDTRAFLACLEIYRQNANFTKSYKSKK